MCAVISKNDALKVERGTSIKNKVPSCLAAKSVSLFKRRLSVPVGRDLEKLHFFFLHARKCPN